MRILRVFIFSVVVCLLLLALIPAKSILAADIFDPVCSQQDANGATVCKDKNVGNENPLYGPNGIITIIINIMSVIAGIAAVIILITAGLRMITGGNNPQQVSQARNLAIFAVVGLIIIASAQLIVRFFLSQVK